MRDKTCKMLGQHRIEKKGTCALALLAGKGMELVSFKMARFPASFPGAGKWNTIPCRNLNCQPWSKVPLGLPHNFEKKNKGENFSNVRAGSRMD